MKYGYFKIGTPEQIILYSHKKTAIITKAFKINCTEV